MLITRFLAAAIALVAGFAFLAPADAGTSVARAGDFGTFNTKAVDSNTLRASGNTIGWARKVVQIQRAPKGTSNWTTIGSDRTDGEGRFAVRLQAGSDIPCTGRQFKVRAKKKGTNISKVDDTTWSC